jgi:hypothetical protein
MKENINELFIDDKTLLVLCAVCALALSMYIKPSLIP